MPLSLAAQQNLNKYLDEYLTLAEIMPFRTNN
eukprot:COSAG05_NODE_23491_length_257_cov_1.715190_2_plen_31_part_01